MVLEELVAVLGWDIQGEEKLRSFNDALERTARHITAFATAAAVAGAGALAALGKSVINVSAQFEQYEATLTTIEGSAEKARQSMDWVADFAKRTPYEVGEVTQAFVRLKAYGLDPMDGALKAAGDAGSAMGLGLMSGVEAIADAMTGENERLKAFGITASVAGDRVTYTWRENGKELHQTLKKSGVEVVKFLEDNFGRRFGGAMDTQSRTWNGMLGNLSDSWTNFNLAIGRAGFFDTMKRQLDRLADYIDQLDKNGTLARWAKDLSHALETAANGIADFVSRIIRHVEKIANLFEKHKDAFNEFKWAILAIGAYLFPVATLLGIAALAVDDFLTYMEDGESVIGDFIDALSKFLGEDPKKVAEVLGNIAAAAGKIAAAAVGMAAFAGALRKVGSALGLLGGAKAGDGLKNLAEAAKKSNGLGGLKFGVLSLFGLDSAIEMISSSPEEGKARGDSWNSWLEKNMGTPRSYLENLMGSGSSANQPKVPYGALSRDPSAHGDALMDNALKNFGRMGSGAAAAIGSTINDNSDRSVQVNITQNIQQASQAPGAAAQATANYVKKAAGASAAPWHIMGEKF